jgi:hypothetical protein
VELRPIHRNYDGRPVIALGQLEVVGLGVAGYFHDTPAAPIQVMSGGRH